MANRLGNDLDIRSLLYNQTPEQQLVSQKPTEDSSGIGSAIKRSIGGGLGSIGRFAQEVGLPSEQLTSYSEQLQKEAGPAPVQKLEDIPRHPGAFVSEGLGAGIGSMTPTVVASGLGNIVGGIAGGAVAGPVGVEAGRRIGGVLARAAVNIPSYIGSNLQRQDETGQHDLGKAVFGALGQAATEELEAQAIGGLLPAGLSKKLGIDAISKLTGGQGFSGGPVSRAVKGALTAGAANAAEEYAQQQIERAQAGLDVGSNEAISEGAFNAALGAVAGAGLGGAAGISNKPQPVNIPGLNQEFTNKDIKESYQRLDELFSQKINAENSGQDTTGFDKDINDIISHLNNQYISPVTEDGKKPSIKPVDSQEAEAVLNYISRLKTPQKASEEEIDIHGLSPLQEMSDEQLAITYDNAARRLKELDSKAEGTEAQSYINPETGKKVKLPGKLAKYLSPDELSERNILRNVLKSKNREALVSWNEQYHKPRLDKAKPVSTEGLSVEEITPEQIQPTEEISIPDISGERYLSETTQERLPEGSAETINITEPAVQPQEDFIPTESPIELKQVNPVRESILAGEQRQLEEEISNREQVAETKTFKAEAPATRLLRKLQLESTHEVKEISPGQFKISRKQDAQAIRSDEGQVQEAGTISEGSKREGSQNLQLPTQREPSNEELRQAETKTREDIRFFKNQVGPTITNSVPEETIDKQVFDLNNDGITVSEITDPEMVDAILKKAFSGQKQTIDLSKITREPKEGIIRRTLQKIKAAINKVADSVKDSGIRIEYAESVRDIPDAKLRESILREVGLGMSVRGLFDDRSDVIYIIGNGFKSPQEAVGTLYHELVGHYGMRKILGKKFDNYMERLLKSPQLTQKIYNLSNRWKTYTQSFPVTKNDSFTWPGLKDSSGNPVVTSRTAAIRLADEYVAELARVFTSPQVVDKYNLRTKENRSFLDRVVSFIKHLFRGIGFGQIVDGLTNEDIMKELAKSYDSIFNQNSLEIDTLNKLYNNPAKLYPDEGPMFNIGGIADTIKQQQITSPEFKEWFGDWENDPWNSSKVVDEDGKPLVVYHGTSNIFNEFKAISHFGTQQAANDRLRDTQKLLKEEKEIEAESGGNIVPVYLNIRNPLDIDDNGLLGMSDYIQAVGEASEDPFTKEERELLKPALLNQRWQNLAKLIESRGYDGLRYINSTEDKGSISWVALYPNQIKSINNLGEFSSSINDFMFDITPTQEESLYNLEEQGFGKTNFDSKTSGWDRFSANLANNPLAKNFPYLGKLQYQNQLMRLYNKARGKTTEIEKLTRQIREKFEPLNKVQKIKLYEMLTTQNYDNSRLSGIIPDDIIQLAQQGKDKVSEYGELLVRLGKLDPVTYEQNKDKYLRTRYAKYLGESKGQGKIGSFQNYLKQKKDLSESEKTGLLEIKDPGFLLSDTLGTIGRDTALLGLLHNIHNLSIQERLGWVIDDPQLFLADGTNLTLEEAREHLEKQKGIIKDQGELVGYDHPEVQELQRKADELDNQINETYRKLDQQIAEFSQQAGMPESMSPKEFADTYYKKLPKGKQYGKLSGMYVRKEIYDDLREGIDAFYNLNTQGKILKNLENMHRLWKTAKVSWNIPTWFQNAFGNFSLLDLASPTNMGSLAQKLIQEVYNTAKGNESKYWTLGQENGVFGTTYASQELYTNEKDFQLKLKKLGELQSGNKFAETWDQLKDFFLLLNDKTSNWYGNLEGAFKVVAIRDHIERWENENNRKFDFLTGNEREALISSAVRFANDAIFDYSAVPNWVKQIRRFPLGSPFITFSYKALPAILKAMRYNPKKFIKYAVLPSLMMQMFLIANPDMDEEDYEEILAKQPQYMQDKSSNYLMPWKNADGKWEFLDAGYLLPWSPFVNWGLYVKNHFDAMNYETTAESTVDAGYQLLANTFGFLGGPAPQMISMWKTGTDPFTKEPVFTEGQPASEKWWKGMTYMSNMLLPSWLGSYGFAGKLQDALGVSVGPFEAEPLNRYGTPKGTVSEAVLGLAGLKLKGISPQESHLSNLKMFEVEEQKIKRAKSSELKNPNLDPKKRLELIKKYNTLLINQRRKRSEYLRSINPED